ncbi:hypothetical protein [Desulfovibrio sp.]|uniref:hypothetical protein n=1 Tax=Desulfovibrio sp. TaxID=885 RepID=UPI0035AE5BC3
MVAQNTAETDEQIIDLTELIEKGAVPANDPSVQSRSHAAAEVEAEKEELQEHLRDLNDGTPGADAEIDDLLAQMDIKADGQEDPADVALDFSAPSTQTDHHIDPNEQLNMPGMGDVDNLLNSLDIPPQPSEREADVATPETPDQAVDALLNDFNAPAPAAAPAADHDVPDLDELLASAAAMPQSGTSSQIDDLLNEAHPAPAPAAAAAPQAAFSHDDLDSLLDAAAGGHAAGGQAAVPSPIQTAEPAQQPAPVPQHVPQHAQGAGMDIDIDSLLAAAASDMQQGFDATQPQAVAAAPAAEPVAAPSPAPAQQPAPAAPADMGIDIDSLLAAAANDLQHNAEAAQPAAGPAPTLAPTPAPAAAPAAPAPAMSNDDLDSLLASATAGLDVPPSPAPAQQPEPAAPADMGIDIDSLLAAAASDLQQSLDSAQPDTPAQQEVAPTAAPLPDMGLDIDSLLAAANDTAQPAAVEPQLAPEAADPFAAAQEAAATAAPVQLEPEVAPELELEPAPEPQPEIVEVLAQDSTPQTAADADVETAPETTADIEALMAAASGEALAAEGSEDQDIPADSADDLLAAMSADLSAQPEADILPEAGADELPIADHDLPLAESELPIAELELPLTETDLPMVEPLTEPAAESDADFAAEQALAAAHEPDMLSQDPFSQDQLVQDMLPEAPEFDTSPAVLAAQQQDDSDPAGTESQAALEATLAAVSAEALDAVMAQANEASSHALDAFAQAFDASSRAADAAEAVGSLAARVEQCERSLQEAGDRIIALETALESQIAASHDLAATALPRQELEGLFMEEHPLHQGLMECISRAVAEALAAAPAPASAPALAAAPQPDMAQVQALIDERLQPVIAAARSANARIDALETRLDALEPRFNDRVEKAAAAAAARILREEISRLLEE